MIYCEKCCTERQMDGWMEGKEERKRAHWGTSARARETHNQFENVVCLSLQINIYQSALVTTGSLVCEIMRCQETFRWIRQAKSTHIRPIERGRASLISIPLAGILGKRKKTVSLRNFRIRKLISDTKKICGFIAIYAVTLFVSLWKLSKHISGSGRSRSSDGNCCHNCCCCCYFYCWCYSLVDWTQFNLFIWNA